MLSNAVYFSANLDKIGNNSESIVYLQRDDELLHLMKEQFDQICFGDLEYLEGTCLYHFSQAIRAGYFIKT